VILGVVGVCAAATVAGGLISGTEAGQKAANLATSPAPTTTTPVASAPTLPSVPDLQANDPHGVRACQLAAKAFNDGHSDKTAVVAPIAAAGVKSTHGDIAFAGQMLADRLALVKAAKGQPDEARLRIDMMTAVIQLVTECTKAGYPT